MINQYITALVDYALKIGLIQNYDRTFTINTLLDLFQKDEYEEPEEKLSEFMSLEDILNKMTDYAYEHNIICKNSITYRDLFDTKIMGCLLAKPSEIIAEFQKLYHMDSKKATDYYYRFSQETNYIRRDRILRDVKWITKTEYGDIDITINLSKPEKDPMDIAAARNMKQSGYPKCLLCKENEGYAGTLNHPARQNHRIIPVTIANEEWGFQYSPYVYYNEHCIVFNKKHIPMKISQETIGKLFDFVRQFPHYFLGSNADLPIVGGSILTHEHFQGGNYTFPLAKAPIEYEFTIKGQEQVVAGIVKWPMSVIRLKAKETEPLINLGGRIIDSWKDYSDESAFLYAYSDMDGNVINKHDGLWRESVKEYEPHNTITPIARKNGDNYELDLILRNNITTKEHPYGVYHPHEELHHIKKENIGLIEVMGLAILPARLIDEMELLKEYILTGKDIASNQVIEKHKKWVEEFIPQYEIVNEENIDNILKNEIGIVFLKVLQHAGVYKRNIEGLQAFLRFIDSIQ